MRFRYSHCDLAAHIGLAWKHGPFSLMNKVGLDRARDVTSQFIQKFNLTLPNSLQQFLQNNQPWKFLHLKTKVDGSIGRIIFSRPDTLNALNMEVLEQLDTAFDSLEKNNAVDTIILETIGKTFIAGADLHFFNTNLVKKDYNAIKGMIEYGHQVFNHIDESPKLVIAKLDGPAFGGGTELAFCADVIIISDKASLCLPETGLGLIPGWGGTQRTAWFSDKRVAKYLVYTGLPLQGREAVELSVAEYHCPNNELEKITLSVAENANRQTKHYRSPSRIPSSMVNLFHMFEYKTVKELLNPNFKGPDDPLSQKALKALRKKSPGALYAAERAIDKGSKLRSLKESLPIEIDEFIKIIEKPDATEGVKAFIERRPPKFLN